MSEPLVSIIVPTKNSASTLEACLESIKNQTYSNLEVILVDNFSTDATQEIARKYTDKVYVQGPERSAQRNFGAKHSEGNFVMFVDSDMQLAPNVIRDCVEKIENDVVGVVIPEESFGKGFWAQCKKLERSFYIGVNWMEAARFLSKATFEHVGGYNESMVSGEDWDLSQRIEKEGRIQRISSFIYHNEGRINLWKTIKKKMYYAGEFKNYTDFNQHNPKLKKQTNLFLRYKLFLSQPIKLFKKPVLGIGVLFMKTCEFGAGGFALGRNKINSIKRSRQNFKVLLLGTHGQKNIGDELLLNTFLFQLKSHSEKDLIFYVNSYRPEETAKVNKVISFHTTKDRLSLLMYIIKCDLILFAGGSIVKELYSAYGRSAYSVLNMLTLLILFAKYFFRKKIIFSNVGIGPLATARGFKQARFLLNSVSFVSVRDKASLKYASLCEPRNIPILVPDAVYSLTKEYLLNGQQVLTALGGKIALNLCRNISNPDKWEEFIEALLYCFEKIHGTDSNIQIIGVPMQSGDGSNDLATLFDFKEKLLVRVPGISFVIENISTFEEASALINDADVLIAERLHALIIANILGKPFVALEYDVKVSALLEDIGLMELGVKICGDFYGEEIYDKYLGVRKKYTDIASKLNRVAEDRRVENDKYFAELNRMYFNL